MLYFTLEQYEIVPSLSFDLSKVGNTSFFSQSFDLSNSLPSFIFAIFFLISINKVLNSKESSIAIPAHIGKKVAELEAEIEEIIEKIINSSTSPTDMSRLIEVILELLQIQKKYKFISQKQEENLCAFLGSFLKK